jgi:hypothetical protein
MYVLSTAQLWMKACADLKQTANTACNRAGAFRGSGDARDDPQECALARAIAPNDAESLARLDFK